MSEKFPPSVQDAIDAALSGQLEAISYGLHQSEVITGIDDCRDAVREWVADESLIAYADVEHLIRLLEDYGDEYGLELGDVTFGNLRQRIDGLATQMVRSLGEQHALEVVDEIEELLDEHELDITNVKTSTAFGYFRPYAVRDEDPWQVFEYRNLEGEGLHLDLYEHTVEGVRFYVERWLERGSLSAEEESWEAS